MPKWMWNGNGFAVCMDKAGGEGGAGGGGSNNPPAAPTAAEFKALQDQNAALLKRFEEFEKKNNPNPNPNSDPNKPDPKETDLAAKAKEKQEEIDKANRSAKQTESALRFTMGSKEWIKINAALLPKNAEGIFAAADKEVYANEVEKANAIKSALVIEFFSQQTNLDHLTEAQKTVLEDFRKLTKTAKEEKAHQIYETIFEPTFEMIKRIKRAELANKGIASPTDAEAAYKAKLIAGSNKHYLKRESK